MQTLMLACESNKLHLSHLGKMLNDSQRFDFLNPNLAK